MDELVKKNFKTSTNSVNTHAHAAAGDPALGNPTRQVSTGTPQRFNRDRTLGNLTSRVSELNGMSSSIRNNVFAETWSEALTQAMMELEEANAINENPDFAVANFRDSPSGLDKSFQATARYIKARKFRNVDRELFVIEDGGYDMHECNCVADKLSMIDAALRSFRDEMKAQGLWDKVVIVTGIDFGRTLTPNRNNGTDHAWGGHYFMMGGDVRGRQIYGSYPDLSPNSTMVLDSRGRMIPSRPFEAMWNGVSQWMGVKDEGRLDYMLPHRKSFPRKCDMFTDQQLFKSGTTPPYPCTGQGKQLRGSQDQMYNV